MQLDPTTIAPRESSSKHSKPRNDSKLDDPLAKVSVAALDFSFQVKHPKKRNSMVKLLDQVTFVASPGEVVVILGASGSGKTTLLNCISKRAVGGEREGEILFNGEELKSRRAVTRIVSYVAQEDTLLGGLTVAETLTFAARFYLGYSKEANANIKERINEVTEVLGLKECLHVIVPTSTQKGLSGGQVRRLSIAVEILASPPIILLDEPTSGLDAVSATKVMELLQTLARLGHTIVTTVHSPSSHVFNQLFDKCLLLCKGGRTAYFGSIEGAVEFFDSVGYECPNHFNPAEFYIDMISDDFDLDVYPKQPSDVKEFIDAFKSSEGLKKIEVSIIAEKKGMGRALSIADITEAADDSPVASSTHHLARHQAGLISNTITLTHRGLLQLYRNPSVIILRAVMYVILAIFLGILFFEKGNQTNDLNILAQTSLMFCTPAFFLFMTISVVPAVSFNTAVYKRETLNGAYSPLPYVISVLLTQIIIGTFIVSICAAVVVGQMAQVRNFWIYFLGLWVNLFVAECFVCFACALIPNFLIAILFVAGFFAGEIATCGFFLTFEEIPWYFRWLGYITHLRYSFRFFMRNQYEDMGTLNSYQYQTGVDVIEFFGMNEDGVKSLGIDVGIILGMGIYFLFLFWGVLMLQQRK
jgi:ABC-type multidrug transport system ATPase subunit